MKISEILDEEIVKAFHGTNQPIEYFQLNTNKAGSSGSREGPLGFWFTDNADVASSFAHWAGRGLGGENVIPVYLEFHHPLVVKEYREIKDIIDKFTKFERPDYFVGGEQIRMMGDKVDYDAARQWIKDQGYDAIVLPDTLTDSPDGKLRITQYLVFDQSQIRSIFK